MRKCDMRLALDKMIEDMEKTLAGLKHLRSEMHNRPPQTSGRRTSKRLDKTRKSAIWDIVITDPSLPQHEIAKMLDLNPGRVSETIAGKRT